LISHRIFHINKSTNRIVLFPLTLSELFVEDNTCCTHTSSNAHGGDTISSLGSLHLREKCSDLSSTSASEGMSDGNSTTLGVNFLHVEAKFLAREKSLRSEGFVDLVDINVIGGQTSFLQNFRDGISGTDSHDFRRNTSNGVGNKSSENR